MGDRRCAVEKMPDRDRLLRIDADRELLFTQVLIDRSIEIDFALPSPPTFLPNADSDAACQLRGCGWWRVAPGWL